jgi:hypothetical protein
MRNGIGWQRAGSREVREGCHHNTGIVADSKAFVVSIPLRNIMRGAARRSAPSAALTACGAIVTAI